MPERTSTVNVARALADITEYWSPKVVSRVNDQYVKVAKVKGELAWHQHDHEDELFFVVYGELRIELPGDVVVLGPGDMFVVPRGTQHNAVAPEECGLVLVETVTTLHTGDVVTPRTKSIEEQL